MSEKVEKNIEETTEEKIEALKLDSAENGGKKKILKWILGGIAVIASGVTGFLLGRGGHDDDDSDDSTEEDTSTNE